MPLTTGVQNQPPKRGFAEGLPDVHLGPENAALYEIGKGELWVEGWSVIQTKELEAPQGLSKIDANLRRLKSEDNQPKAKQYRVNDKKILSIAERNEQCCLHDAATILGINFGTIRRYRKKYHLKTVRVGRFVLVEKAEIAILAAYLHQTRVKSRDFEGYRKFFNALGIK
ncbi:hypothetical protein LCGC14_1209670 [marine sediment metagenome]|uniref:Uncharacterized protein n=1 Tax=marine sediment metagenome TaxID=412755 RepID=A0A0F9NWU1_9ZZZZ